MIPNWLFDLHPFLWDVYPSGHVSSGEHSGGHSGVHHGGGHNAGGGHGHGHGHGDSPAISPEELQKAADELREMRADWNIDPDNEDPFYLHVRGGPWLAKHKQKAADVVCVKARAGCPRKFGRLYGMGVMRGWSLGKFSGHDIAMLALETQRRWKFFYEMWLFSDEETPVFSQEDIDSYEQDPEWLEWALAQYDNDPLWNRIQQVVQTVPKPPTGVDDDDADDWASDDGEEDEFDE